jgi:hypothetical protein
MNWIQVVVIVFGNFAWLIPLFFWVRSESRADIRHLDAKIDAIRELTYAIHLEMKDFHSKLYELEKKRTP